MSKKVTKGGKSSPLYRESLGDKEKARYLEKLSLIDGNDPYEMKTFKVDEKLLPSISYPDIVNYLVFSPSPYTLDDLKSYKGLDAYNQFVCGWVREVSTAVVNDKCIVTAKVLHSQRLSEKPLLPWIVCEKSGKVLSAHCTCMAGLGEACSHIGALLFAVEGTVKIRDSATVTQEPAYWLIPTAIKNITYSEIKDIDFTSAKTLKRTFDACCAKEQPPQVSPSASRKLIPRPSDAEVSDFFRKLNDTGTKAAVLALVEPYCKHYAPKAVSENFPLVLTELREDGSI